MIHGILFGLGLIAAFVVVRTTTMNFSRHTLLLSAAALGGVLLTGAIYYETHRTILVCQVAQTDTNSGHTSTPFNSSMVIELHATQWRRSDGDGPDSKFSPLRVADDSYILFEGRTSSDADYSLRETPLSINRITGEISHSTTVYSTNQHWADTQSLTGHCEPVQGNAF
jgi:hypothetical protein